MSKKRKKPNKWANLNKKPDDPEQMRLFAPGGETSYKGAPPFHRHPEVDTSAAAATAMKAHYGSLQWDVLELIAARSDGMMDCELFPHFPGRPDVSRLIAPRRNELLNKKLVEDSGERRKNPATNHKQIVWKVTPRGFKILNNGRNE